MRGKINRLEIERLAKLYAIEGINEEQKKEFIQIIKELTREDEIEEGKKIGGAIIQLLKEDIEKLNILEMEENITQHKMNAHSKTALLRILKTRIEKSNIEDKEQILRELEEKYGEKAAIEQDDPEKDILRSENIELIKNNPEELARIHDPEEYLKAKDIRAMRFVFLCFSENFSSDNAEINLYLEEVRTAETEEEKRKAEDRVLIALEKEVATKLLSDTNFLESMGIELMPNAYKHKNKPNGYIADHLKFRFKDRPECIFELQLRTIYREEMAKNGEAAHDQRPGKTRKKPRLQNRTTKTFMQEVKDMVPKYTLIKQGKIYKCNWLENTMGYFQDYIDLKNKEDIKMLQTIKEEQQTHGRG